MESDFILSGSINKKILKRMKKYLLPPSLTRFINITIFIAGLLSLFFFLLRFQSQALTFLVGALFIYAEKLFGRIIYVKKLLNMIDPDQSSLDYKLFFRDEHMTISLDYEEEGFDIDYSNFSRIAETKNYIVLFTYENMCFPIYKTFINRDEKNEWLVYIMARNNKIRLYNIK